MLQNSSFTITSRRTLYFAVLIVAISQLLFIQSRTHYQMFRSYSMFKRVSRQKNALHTTSPGKFPLHPSFELLQTSTVNEYGLLTGLYKHKNTGGEVLSVISDDNNKVFGITFRTPPTDSTGVPHILEHSVLCGSRKYKSKEPFAELLKGSLQTFLNAFTYPDRTCYPVASLNKKDFYNLIDVYLDAVFFPRAKSDPQVLQQEGWHLDIEDASRPLSYKGVVFNEMKGVYSSPEALMGRAAQQALFPDTTYHVDSGGDPNDIPSLTFDAFTRFHSATYHPSNSRTFFYGDDDPLRRLEIVDEYFKHFNKISVDHTRVSTQKRLSLRSGGVSWSDRVLVKYPSAGSDTKRMFTMNWLLNEEPLSGRDRLSLSILNHALLGTSASALSKALIDSKLGESVTGGGSSEELLQATFSVGMKGVEPDNVTAVCELILSTLRDLSERGLDEGAIRASVNTLEFHLREFNTGGYPRGLSLMLESLTEWIYDRDPVAPLRFEENLTLLKRDLADGKPIFQDLINKYFLSNDHVVVVEMVPDTDMEQRTLDEDLQKMDAIKASLSPEQIQTLVDETGKLRAAQLAEDSPEAKDTLPRLCLADIDPNPKEIPTRVSTLSPPCLGSPVATLLTHELSSSGILYADIAFDFSRIPIADLGLLPLFSRLMMDSGTKSRDHVSLSRYIGAETGGIGTSWYTDLRTKSGIISDPDDALMYFMMRGKCTADKIPVMFDIMGELLTSSLLDNQKRAEEMVLEGRARRVSTVTSNGHRYAAMRLFSDASVLAYMAEQMSGLTYLRTLDQLLSEIRNNWPEVVVRLENIRSVILSSPLRSAVTKDSTVINLTGDEGIMKGAEAAAASFLARLATSRSTASPPLHSPPLLEAWKSIKASSSVPPREGVMVASQVNYVTKGGQIFQPGEVVKGSSSVVSRYLSNGYLWDHVRVIGGAYGGFGKFSGDTGNFVFASYRDPNLLETLRVYDKASDWLQTSSVSEEKILQTVIGTIGDNDSPLSVDQKGFSGMAIYLCGESPEDRATWRREILHTSPQDFKDFSSRLSGMKKAGGVVVFGSKAGLESLNNDLIQAGDDPLQLSAAFVGGDMVESDEGAEEGEGEEL